MWLTSNHMFGSGNFWDKSPSRLNFEIFKNALGRFTTNCLPKHVITSTNVTKIQKIREENSKTRTCWLNVFAVVLRSSPWSFLFSYLYYYSCQHKMFFNAIKTIGKDIQRCVSRMLGTYMMVLEVVNYRDKGRHFRY